MTIIKNDIPISEYGVNPNMSIYQEQLSHFFRSFGEAGEKSK